MPRMTTFLENLEKSGNFFTSGKSQGNHDCAILSAFITNSNFPFKSTENAHICLEGFTIFLGVIPPDPLYWEMDTSTDPTPLALSWLDFGATRLGSKPSISRPSIPDPVLNNPFFNMMNTNLN